MKKIASLILMTLLSASVFADSYTLYTIKQKDKSNAENFFVDVSEELFKRAGLSLRVKPNHWIQAQRKVSNATPDQKLLITPLTRTNDRENDYDWILPFEKYKLQLVSNDKTLNITDTNVLKELPVCALRESPAEAKLHDLGFTNIKAQVQEKNCFEQLLKGKIKLIMAHGDIAASKRYASIGGNSDDLIYGLSFREETLYLASSKQAVAKSDLEKLKTALSDMRTDGTYDKLKEKY